MPTRKPAPKRKPAPPPRKPAPAAKTRAAAQPARKPPPAPLRKPAPRPPAKAASPRVKPLPPKAIPRQAARPKPAPRAAPAPPPPPKPRRRRGKPPHVPDDKTKARVTAWSGGGIAQDMIAASLGITTPTLVKHYKTELAIGKAMMDGLAISALARAMQGSGKDAVTAAKWWTQTRMGWTEHVVVDNRLPDTPMRVIIELVGDPPADQNRPAKTRPGFDSSIVQLVG